MKAATTLRDVVVTNEQTRARWDAGRASIEQGLIVIAPAATPPPDEMFENPASTFTLTARDGVDRTRRFPNLTYAVAASDPPRRYAFR
jgi:hypothetical protein